MTDDYELYKMYGQRCKKARKALGWSCAALAEKMHTSPQNINKLENDGIKDIATLKRLGETLGCDLEQQPKEEEGVLGEVGKEILAALIKNRGYLDFERLVYVYLCGMSEDDAEYEVSQLHRMGMCNRDHYIDLNDRQCDGVFITAKGVISFKNNNTNTLLTEDIRQCLKDVVVYEKRTHGCDYYQEYLSKRKWEKVIRKLRINTPYRAGYIAWLKRNFISEDLYGSHSDYSFQSDMDENLRIKHWVLDEQVIPTDVFLEDDRYYDGAWYFHPKWKENGKVTERMSWLLATEEVVGQPAYLIPGVSLEYDIFYLMAMGLDNAAFSKMIAKTKEEIAEAKKEALQEQEEQDDDDRIFNSNDDDLKAYGKHFAAIDIVRKTIYGYRNTDDENRATRDTDQLLNSVHKEIKEAEERNKLTGENYSKWLSGISGTCYEALRQELEALEGGKGKIDQKRIEAINRRFCSPYRWFTREATEKFVESNFHSAETPEEKEIDKILAKLNKEVPETLDYYYETTDFSPYLALKICNLYGLPSRVYTDEIHEIEEEAARLKEEEAVQVKEKSEEN